MSLAGVSEFITMLEEHLGLPGLVLGKTLLTIGPLGLICAALIYIYKTTTIAVAGATAIYHRSISIRAIFSRQSLSSPISLVVVVLIIIISMQYVVESVYIPRIEQETDRAIKEIRAAVELNEMVANQSIAEIKAATDLHRMIVNQTTNQLHQDVAQLELRTRKLQNKVSHLP